MPATARQAREVHVLDSARAVPRRTPGVTAGFATLARRLHPSDAPVIERHVWGTILRASTRPSFTLHLTQWIAWALAVAMVIGSLALIASSGWDLMALAAGALGLGAAAPLLFFASRGSVGEVHFDRDLGEMREMVLHRLGRPTLLSKRRIDDMVGAELMPLGGRRQLLVIRCRNDDVVPVAAGTMEVLNPLIAEVETAMLVEEAPAPAVAPRRRAFASAARRSAAA